MKPMKIVLAVDPFEEILQFSPPDFNCLKSWVKDPKTDIIPVYVVPLSMSHQNLGEIWLPPQFQDFAPLRVVSATALGRKREVDALLSVASQSNSDVIVLLSQGTLTAKKLFGGFAEAALLKSEKPVLFLADGSEKRPPYKKVIFATDFSKESFEAFSVLISQIKQLNLGVILFHAIPVPSFTRIGPIYQQALDILPASYWITQEEWAHSQADPFLHLACEHKVNCKLIVRSQVISIEDSLKDLLEVEKTSLIAMVTVSSSLQRLLVGSISRFILRHRKQPVWLCGTQGLKS